MEALLTSNVFDFNKQEFFFQLEKAALYGRRYGRYILYKLDMIYGGGGNRLQPCHDAAFVVEPAAVRARPCWRARFRQRGAISGRRLPAVSWR